MKKHKIKKSRKILIAGLAIVSIIAIPVSVVACGANVTLPVASEKDVNDAQTSLNTAINDKVITLTTQANDIYVNLIQNYNIQNYLQGLPELNLGMEYIYSISAPDSTTGSVALSISVYGGINSNFYSQTPSSIVLTGFKKGIPPAATQAEVNGAQYTLNNVLNSQVVALNASGYFVFANTITASNVQSYLTGLPILSNNMIYNYQVNSTNQQKGLISITISVSAGSIVNTQTALPHDIYGFILPLSLDVLNANITTINGQLTSKPISIKVNTEGAKVEAQNVNNTNISSYLTGLGILPKNANYVFQITDNTAANSTSIKLQIWLTSGSTITSNKSDAVTIDGFAKNTVPATS